jgi:hypothetical protein
LAKEHLRFPELNNFFRLLQKIIESEVDWGNNKRLNFRVDLVVKYQFIINIYKSSWDFMIRWKYLISRESSRILGKLKDYWDRFLSLWAIKAGYVSSGNYNRKCKSFYRTV